MLDYYKSKVLPDMLLIIFTMCSIRELPSSRDQSKTTLTSAKHLHTCHRRGLRYLIGIVFNQ